MPDSNTNAITSLVDPKQPKPPTGFAEKASGLLDNIFSPIAKPVGQAAGAVASGLASTFAPGQENAWRRGAQQGAEGLPRTAAEALATSEGAGWVPKALGFGDVALRSFAETSPDQPLAQRLGSTALQTAAFHVAPKIGGVGGRIAETLAPETVSPLVRTAIRRGASTVGTLGAFEGANAASAKIQGQPYNPFTPEHIAGVAASVLPFEAAGVVHDVKDYHNMKLQELSNELVRQQTAKSVLNTRQESEHQEPIPVSKPTKPAQVLAPALAQHTSATPSTQLPGDFDRYKELTSQISAEPDFAKKFELAKEVEQIKNRNGGMPPAEQLGEQKPTTTTIPQKLTLDERNYLSSLEELGHNTDELAKIGTNLMKVRGKLEELKSPVEKFGIDPRINLPNDPDTLLKSAKSTVEFMTREVLGMPEESVQAWTRRFLTFVQLAGPTQDRTRIIPAVPFTDPTDNMRHETSFFAPSRGELPNALIGVSTRTMNTTDRSMLEFFHSTAHELFHGAMMQNEGVTWHGKLPARMVDHAHKLLAAANEMNLSQTEMEQAIEGTLRSMASAAHTGLLKFRNQYYTPTPEGRTEFLADMYGLLAMGAMDKSTGKPYKTVSDYMKFAGDDFRGFAKGMFKDIGSVFDMMKNYLKNQFGWGPDGIKTVKGLVDNMKGLMGDLDKADKGTQLFLMHDQLRRATPYQPIAGVSYDKIDRLYKELGADGYDPELKAMVHEISPMVAPQSDRKMPKELPAHLKWLDYFKALPQFVRDYPQMADMARLGRAYQGMVKEVAMDAWSQFKDFETGRYDVQGMIKLMTPGTQVNRAFNVVTLRQNELKDADAGRRLTPSELGQIPEYARLSPPDKEFVDKHLDRVSSASMVSARHQVKSQYDKTATYVARAWTTHDPALQWDKAYELGKALTSQYMDVDRLQPDPKADPELAKEVADGAAKLEAYAQMNPKALGEMMEIFTKDKNDNPLEAGKVSEVVQGYRNYREQLMGKWLPPDKDTEVAHFEGKPGYTSEVRLGDFLLMWKKKDEQPYLVGVKTRKDYNEKYGKLMEEYNEDLKKPADSREFEYFKGVDKATEVDKFAGLRPDLFKTYNEAITSLNNRVLFKVQRNYPGSEDLVNELREELRPAGEMVKLMEAPFMKERRLYGGREDLNMAEGMIHHINNVAYTVAKRQLKGQQNLYLQDPKMRAQPELQSIARKYFSEITDPTEKGYAGLKALTAFNYIFFSPSLAYVELTQQLANHVPALASAGMGIGDAYKGVASANLDMVQAIMKGKNEKAGKNIYSNPEETLAVDRAKQSGIIDQGWLQEFFHLEDDLPFLNARNVFAGNGNVFDKQGLVGKPLYYLYRLGVKAHSIAITVNTEVAFLSAFRHFRKTNDYETAFKLADDLSHESMHGGVEPVDRYGFWVKGQEAQAQLLGD